MKAPAEEMPARAHDRVRIAELTSGIGAVALGVGLGALLADRLAGLAVPVLLLGVATHAWAMLDKHRVEKGLGLGGAWWESAAHGSCWLLLALMVLLVWLNVL